MDTFIRYVVLGGVGFSLSIFMTWFFHEKLLLSESVSVALALVILFFFNFFMARHHVFKNQSDGVGQGFRFLGVSLSMRIIEYALFLALFHGAEIFYLFSYTSSILIVFVLKYILYKNFVFNSLKE